MPFYHKLGEIPSVKPTTFYQPDGKTLYREELVSSKGFSGIYSNVYHHYLPTAVKTVKEIKLRDDTLWPEAPVLYYHCFTDKNKRDGNFITARDEFLVNSTCKILCAKMWLSPHYRSKMSSSMPQTLRKTSFLFRPS